MARICVSAIDGSSKLVNGMLIKAILYICSSSPGLAIVLPKRLCHGHVLTSQLCSTLQYLDTETAAAVTCDVASQRRTTFQKSRPGCSEHLFLQIFSFCVQIGPDQRLGIVL